MKKVGKINAVLIELVIVVLFFAIAAVITIQLFAKSYSIEASSAAKTELTAIVENQMNDYRSGKASLGSKIIYFDEQMRECDEAKAYYIEELQATNDDNLPLINVKVRVTDAKGGGIMSFGTSYERQV